MGHYKDKTAIVTGAASGIGAQICRELLERGCSVVAADINQDALDREIESLKDKGLSAKGEVVDVTDREAVKKLVDKTVSEHSRLDFMFNNAGVGVAGEVRDYSYEDWSDVIDSNVYGVINGVHAAYPVMVREGSGHIVNTSSIAGLVPFPPETSYAAAKHAIVGLSLTLRTEAADLGVKVSVACPGLIDTPIWQTNRLVNLDREKALSAIPIRLSSPKRCAREILEGVRKNRPIIVITSSAKVLWYMNRISPSLALWFQTRQMRRFREARVEK